MRENIQAVLFDRKKYTYAKCVAWLLSHGYLKWRSYRNTTNLIRFRISEPNEYKYNYRIHHLGNGISFILQYSKQIL